MFTHVFACSMGGGMTAWTREKRMLFKICTEAREVKNAIFQGLACPNVSFGNIRPFFCASRFSIQIASYSNRIELRSFQNCKFSETISSKRKFKISSSRSRAVLKLTTLLIKISPNSVSLWLRLSRAVHYHYYFFFINPRALFKIVVFFLSSILLKITSSYRSHRRRRKLNRERL